MADTSKQEGPKGTAPGTTTPDAPMAPMPEPVSERGAQGEEEQLAATIPPSAPSTNRAEVLSTALTAAQLLDIDEDERTEAAFVPPLAPSPVPNVSDYGVALDDPQLISTAPSLPRPNEDASLALKQALERLYGLIGRGKRQELAPLLEVAEKLGHPERSFRAVHVAGTNGKGTVCAFLASMNRAAGVKVGLYTSPHLVRFAERIRIDGEPLPDGTLARLLNQVMDVGPELTFFEVTTMAAFLAFREAGVERAIIEVGLGGRLDASNIIPPPEIAIITRVAFDHMAELGNSLKQIAAEKAAIIKPGCKVVVGRLHPDALAIVEARAAEVGAELLPLGSPEPIPGAPLAYPRLSMIGSNLAVAVTAGRALNFTPEQLASGVETMEWPGRNELLHRNRRELTLLDCAHNPDGALTLAHSLDPTLLEVESRRNIALVFGTIQGKNYRAMLKRLASSAAHRIYVAPPVAKAEDPQAYQQVLPGEIATSVEAALERAREIVGIDGVVVVTGSCFLVGAARAILLDLPRDPAVAL